MSGLLNDNDSSWTSVRAQEAIDIARHEYTRPAVVWKPKVYLDGDMWCALYGDNLQDSVCAFGKSPDEATRNFDKAWHEPLTESKRDDQQEIDQQNIRYM
jgi:hypothetical protein